MRDRSLVAFTLLSQLAVGALWVWGGLHLWVLRRAGAAGVTTPVPGILFAVAPLMVLALLSAFFHLGTPLGGWRALANLRSSWLSREVLCALLFTASCALLAGLEWLEVGTSTARCTLAWGVALLGLALLACMAGAYRLRTVPAWDTWLTPVSFLTTALLLGGLAVGVALAIDPNAPLQLLRWISLGAVLLLVIEIAIGRRWLADLANQGEAASRAAARITQECRPLYRLRLVFALLGLAAASALLLPWGEGSARALAAILAFGLVMASEILSRLLFYEARVRHGV
jgi:anaerobic dimethyl sulfoxide reductase subunit C (anchor subunit)